MVLLPRDSQCHEEVSTTTFTCHCTSDRTDGSSPSQYVTAASGGGGGGVVSLLPSLLLLLIFI